MNAKGTHSSKTSVVPRVNVNIGFQSSCCTKKKNNNPQDVLPHVGKGGWGGGDHFRWVEPAASNLKSYELRPTIPDSESKKKTLPKPCGPKGLHQRACRKKHRSLAKGGPRAPQKVEQAKNRAPLRSLKTLNNKSPGSLGCRTTTEKKLNAAVKVP